YTIFFHVPAPPGISTLSLHDALPISEGPTPEPPGHARPPSSFLSWAYPMPRRMAMRFAIGGWVASASAKRPSRAVRRRPSGSVRSEEHTSELQSRFDLVCRLLLEKKK